MEEMADNSQEEILPGQASPILQDLEEEHSQPIVRRKPSAAKAKATVRPKTVMKATLKKPAASSQKDTPRKRPAANLDEAQPKGQPKTKVVKTNEWAKGSKLIPPEEEDADEEEAEEECLESDPIQDEEPFEFDDKRKDRSKDNKFKLLLAQGTLPDWIKEAWEKTKSMRTGRSAAQRKIVNEALTRSPEGALELTLDKPSLQHLKDYDLHSFTVYKSIAMYLLENFTSIKSNVSCACTRQTQIA